MPDYKKTNAAPSTVTRDLHDLEQPTGGEISVNGMTPDDARRARAYGYVFQAAGLYPWRTIGGNIRLPLEIMGFSKAEQAERVNRVMDLVDLAGFENDLGQFFVLGLDSHIESDGSTFGVSFE